ncbi:MFS transporter [Mesobacillus zeae]|uniref:MFS transporter n=1 Tax=Mesobacillus zeae TaxID=1917180 RepID=A0A398B356_9BACI|nr:MFS transporter [Mesobacillus zeae]RID82263.1 MFS transporter [Mesobacillus zeae]
MKTLSFRLLWISQALANSGDIFYIVGLISVIHEISGSPLAMSMVPFISVMSRFVSGMLAPVLFDRYGLKKLLFQSQLWKTAVLFVLAAVLIAMESKSMVIYFVLSGLISLLDGVAAPITSSLTPKIVEKSELIKANSFLAIVTQTVQVAGWPAGAILISFAGADKAVMLTLALYVISSFCIFFIQIYGSESMAPLKPRGSFLSGWKALWAFPAIRSIALMEFFTLIAGGVWVAAVLYIYVEELGAGEEWWGYINSSYFIGTIFGGYLAYRWSKILENHLPAVMILSSLAIAVLTATFGLTRLPTAALVLSALCGIPYQLKEVANNTIIQFRSPDDLVAKIYSSMAVVINLTFGFSVLLIGWIAETFGVRNAFLFASALILVSAGIAYANKGNLTLENQERTTADS